MTRTMGRLIAEETPGEPTMSGYGPERKRHTVASGYTVGLPGRTPLVVEDGKVMTLHVKTLASLDGPGLRTTLPRGVWKIWLARGVR